MRSGMASPVIGGVRINQDFAFGYIADGKGFAEVLRSKHE